MLTWEEQNLIEQAVYPAYTEAAYGEMRRRLAAALTPGALVLDAGSGPGTWLLRRYRADINLVGLDLFRPDPLPSHRYAIGSLDAIPYRDALFDLVLCYDVIEHLA
ncbi:MAG: class I SAM-dependent methyltransferase, partial [Anaerolineae bacterium]